MYLCFVVVFRVFLLVAVMIFVIDRMMVVSFICEFDSKTKQLQLVHVQITINN